MQSTGNRLSAAYCLIFGIFASFNVQANLPDFTELVARNSPSVVNVEAIYGTGEVESGGEFSPGPGHPQIPDFFRRFFDSPELQRMPERKATGSGFVVDEAGYVLTNHHVVDGADEIILRFSDRRELRAEVVGADPDTDIALLKVDADDLRAVSLGDADSLKPGQWVVAIGSPFNFDHSVTAGIVSAIGRHFSRQQYVPFIQTDVPINQGNSGGPLINMAGEVVGINSQIFSSNGGYMGISFAIPIDVAMTVVQQLRDNGQISRGYLGVGYQEVTRDLAEMLGLDRPQGALINHVESGSAADKAGIKVRDVVLKFNGNDVLRAADLPPAVGRVSPGTSVDVSVYRDGHPLQLTLEVGSAPVAAVAQEIPQATPEVMEDRLGLVVRAPEENEVAGVTIVDITGGDARNSGVEVGDVITMINNFKIANIGDYEAALEAIGNKNSVALLISRDGNTQFLVIKTS